MMALEGDGQSREDAEEKFDFPMGTIRPTEGPDAIEDSFDIDDYTRWRLLEGLDDIGITLGHADAIGAFEDQRPSWKPVTIH